MTITEHVGQIVGLKRLANSLNGNPQYEITFETPTETFKVHTRPNSPLAYSVTNQWLKQQGKLLTNGRNQIVGFIERTK